MADDKAPSLFMNLPLEVRHGIFEHATTRDGKPKKLLRYWFERKEAKEIIAKTAATNPNGQMPQIVYDDDDDEDSDMDEEEVEDQDSAGEDEDADEDEDQEDEDDMDQDDAEDAEADMLEEDGVENMDEDQDDEGVDDPEQVEADMEDEHDTELGEADDAETDTQGDNDADEDNDEAMAEDDNNIQGEETGHGGDTADADATQTPHPPRPIVRAHHKWRHIPNFMRLTHCPPPVELLLTSKQLNDEAKNWYYDVAVLRIEATGSFSHTSFYEEAFSQITEAAFSPMENIRKVEVTFVWDTTWIRADTTGCVDAIFPALLRQRANFVYKILQQAPDLQEVVIHWHDSARDHESANLRIDVLEPFDNLPATVEIIEHYIPADSKPNSRSIAGKRRVEFQNILDMGLDRLF
ncbi:hypothetical protein N0V83_010206 [Neocucurbitaria cava]|uniref:Uncharacterized protein n=1 Tax=Neocucurbitaria cava TaxID=798079 RepID=A0A9W9CHT4_9PLEO|nr:hypothetical protein N0V83_010206 [Neocucurbitaria cava]